MVMCIVVGCASKSDTAKGVGMFCIPSVIYNQGEEMEELTRMRREKWISVISRDDVKYKDILKCYYDENFCFSFRVFLT